MDPESKGEPKRIKRLKGKWPPPISTDIEDGIKEKNATYLTGDELEILAGSKVGKLPLGIYLNPIKDVLNLLKSKKK